MPLALDPARACWGYSSDSGCYSCKIAFAILDLPTSDEEGIMRKLVTLLGLPLLLAAALVAVAPPAGASPRWDPNRPEVGAKVEVSGNRVLYRDPQTQAVLAVNWVAGRGYEGCKNIATGRWCFRRFHAIELRPSDNWWRGYVEFSCTTNGLHSYCNFRHPDFCVLGVSQVICKDFADVLNKPVAVYGGTFRSPNFDGRRYQQQSSYPSDRSYYARDVHTQVKSADHYGCSGIYNYDSGSQFPSGCPLDVAR